MRTFNFGLLAVLSCIAMIGATPIGNDAPAEAIGRRQQSMYVPWSLAAAQGGSEPIIILSPALALLLSPSLFLSDAILVLALEAVIVAISERRKGKGRKAIASGMRRTGNERF